jgi:hypothetical protein
MSSIHIGGAGNGADASRGRSSETSIFITMQSSVHALHNFPAVVEACEATRRAARLQYRTRLKEVTPPAFAVSLPARCLPQPGGVAASRGNAILVGLPQDYEGHLLALADAARIIYVHADIGLAAQAAYLSLSLPAKPRALPMTVWLELRHVIEASQHNEKYVGSPDVNIAFTAGNELAATSVVRDVAMKKRWEDASRAGGKPPYSNEERRAKAPDTAARYGERPWLFMRYELWAGANRLAVNWAPFPADLPACVL